MRELAVREIDEVNGGLAGAVLLGIAVVAVAVAIYEAGEQAGYENNRDTTCQESDGTGG